MDEVSVCYIWKLKAKEILIREFLSAVFIKKGSVGHIHTKYADVHVTCGKLSGVKVLYDYFVQVIKNLSLTQRKAGRAI